jgi:hypothetical protein
MGRSIGRSIGRIMGRRPGRGTSRDIVRWSNDRLAIHQYTLEMATDIRILKGAIDI